MITGFVPRQDKQSGKIHGRELSESGYCLIRIIVYESRLLSYGHNGTGGLTGTLFCTGN